MGNYTCIDLKQKSASLHPSAKMEAKMEESIMSIRRSNHNRSKQRNWGSLLLKASVAASTVINVSSFTSRVVSCSTTATMIGSPGCSSTSSSSTRTTSLSSYPLNPPSLQILHHESSYLYSPSSRAISCSCLHANSYYHSPIQPYWKQSNLIMKMSSKDSASPSSSSSSRGGGGKSDWFPKRNRIESEYKDFSFSSNPVIENRNTLSMNENIDDINNDFLVDLPWLLTSGQIKALKVAELRDACAARNLSTSGKKEELQNRLFKWTSDSDA